MRPTARRNIGFDSVADSIAAARRHLDLLHRELRASKEEIRAARDFLDASRKWLEEFDAKFHAARKSKKDGGPTHASWSPREE